MLKSYHLGKLKAWLGSQDGEHPARWAGVWIPRLGEIELHVTSNVIHPSPTQENDLDCWYECPYPEAVHALYPIEVGHDFIPKP